MQLLATLSATLSATRLSTHCTSLCFLDHDYHHQHSLLLCLFITLEWLLFTACILKPYASFKVRLRFRLDEGLTHSHLQLAVQYFIHAFIQHMCIVLFIIVYLSLFVFFRYKPLFSFYYFNSEHNALYLAASTNPLIIQLRCLSSVVMRTY